MSRVQRQRRGHTQNNKHRLPLQFLQFSSGYLLPLLLHKLRVRLPALLNLLMMLPLRVSKVAGCKSCVKKKKRRRSSYTVHTRLRLNERLAIERSQQTDVRDCKKTASKRLKTHAQRAKVVNV
jgi:hypothetical protein